MSKLITIREIIDPLWGFTDTAYADLNAVDNLFRIMGAGPAYIAGGYFRDIENGRPFKDIDVFLPGEEPSCNDEPLRYDLHGAVEVTVSGVTVNVIRLRHRVNLVSTLTRMDIGLCQIGLDDGKLVATQAYLDDVANKTITVKFPPQNEADHDHITRVAAKYPDFAVVHAYG